MPVSQLFRGGPGTEAVGLSAGRRNEALFDVLRSLIGPDLNRAQEAGLPEPDQMLEGGITAAWRRFPAQPAEYADYPDEIDTRLRAALVASGIVQPYVHQAEPGHRPSRVHFVLDQLPHE